MHQLKKILNLIDAISVSSGNFLSFWTFFAVILITYEVVTRYVFNRPTNWAHESMTLIFGMQYILAGAYVHHLRAHVRVDVIYSLWSPRTRARVDVVTSLLFFVYVGVLAYTGGWYYWDSQMMGELSFTEWAPWYYPVKFTVFLGATMLLLQGFAWFVRDLYCAITGNELE